MPSLLDQDWECHENSIKTMYELFD
jgi:hypothetical protein